MTTDALLLIEDEQLLGDELGRHFLRNDWQVLRAKTLADARRSLFGQGIEPLVVIADINLPDGNALELLEEVRGHGVQGEWIFLTGYGGIPESVRALRLGAFDFLEKPCELAHLDLVLAGAARSARAQRQLTDEISMRARKFGPDSFIGRSAAAARVRELLTKLALMPISALVILGETGTGKGLAARILHHAGERARGPLIEVNCAALPKELLESELFGHESGAFTDAKSRRRGLMEQANGGTLFLDEIAELTLELQAKVLKAIEDKMIRRLGGDQEIRVDARIIVATNRNLQDEVAAGRFRADLFHRLDVFRLDLPALRDRREDLADLVPAMVAEFNAKSGRRVKDIPSECWRRLHAHDWPGNVRELRNVIERCVLFSEGDQLSTEWLQVSQVQADGNNGAGRGEGLWLPLDGSLSLEEMDRAIIKSVLESHDFNILASARALGTTRETLRYRIQKYRLECGG